MKTSFKRLQFAFAVGGILSLAGCPGGRTDIVCRADGAFVCPAGLYCNLGNNCGGLDHDGICVPLPHDCDTVDEPVCSCSGKNYQNSCYANAAGDSVAYRGACMSK